MESQLGTPDALMGVRDEHADIADAPIVASNPTELITPGPTIASSSEQVTLHEPILNQPITPLMHLVPKLTLISPQGFNISDLLSFDPASMGLIAPGAKVPPPQ